MGPLENSVSTGTRCLAHGSGTQSPLFGRPPLDGLRDRFTPHIINRQKVHATDYRSMISV